MPIDKRAEPCHTKGMKKTTMTTTTTYTIQFWDGRTNEWKGCGAGTFTDLDQARHALRGNLEMCGGVVEFRIVLAS